MVMMNKKKKNKLDTTPGIKELMVVYGKRYENKPGHGYCMEGEIEDKIRAMIREEIEKFTKKDKTLEFLRDEWSAYDEVDVYHSNSSRLFIRDRE